MNGSCWSRCLQVGICLPLIGRRLMSAPRCSGPHVTAPRPRSSSFKHGQTAGESSCAIPRDTPWCACVLWFVLGTACVFRFDFLCFAERARWIERAVVFFLLRTTSLLPTFLSRHITAHISKTATYPRTHSQSSTNTQCLSSETHPLALAPVVVLEEEEACSVLPPRTSPIFSPMRVRLRRHKAEGDYSARIPNRARLAVQVLVVVEEDCLAPRRRRLSQLLAAVVFSDRRRITPRVRLVGQEAEDCLDRRRITSRGQLAEAEEVFSVRQRRRTSLLVVLEAVCSDHPLRRINLPVALGVGCSGHPLRRINLLAALGVGCSDRPLRRTNPLAAPGEVCLDRLWDSSRSLQELGSLGEQGLVPSNSNLNSSNNNSSQVCLAARC